MTKLSQYLDRRQFVGRTATTAAALGLGALPGTPAFAQASAKADPNDPVLGPLIEGARREGTITILGVLLQKAEGRKGFADAFKAYYGLPDSFNVDWVVKPVGATQKQVQDEIAASKVSADVVTLNTVGFADALAKRRVLMAFDAPEYAAFDHLKDRPLFVNRPYYVCDPGYLVMISWNTQVIKDAKFESWFDLLKPEYKGKISCHSARITPSFAISYYGMKNDPAIGPDFFKRLAELEPVTPQISEQAADRVLTGEFPIAVSAGPRIYAYWEQGAKHLRMSFPKEGTVQLPNYWFGLAAAPHPNAAKLVLNFARSRVAAQLLMEREARMSGRNDVVSPNRVHPADRRSQVDLCRPAQADAARHARAGRGVARDVWHVSYRAAVILRRARSARLEGCSSGVRPSRLACFAGSHLRMTIHRARIGRGGYV